MPLIFNYRFQNKLASLLFCLQAYLGPNQATVIERFAKIVNGQEPIVS